MPKTFTLRIDTPERVFYTGPVEKLVITSSDGEIGILPEHLSMVVAMSTAPARIFADGKWLMAAVSGGFARIKGDEVIILADSAEWPDEIEENRAAEARKRAEERLQTRLSEIEYMRSRVALERALTRLTVKRGKVN
jgi:F-type H+-transporting ATPase subunit epsilon